jgi:molybdopterin converting factor small subunit
LAFDVKKLISIEFFGMQRAITKIDRIAMPITENMKVTDVLEYVRNRYPSLPLDKGMVLITVNQEMASLDTMLNANDTVLFLPFISGG